MSLPKANSPEISTRGQPVDIVADDRERASGVIALLSSIPEICVRIERLSAGDYLADRRILFERKTLQDFADMAAYLQSLPVVGNIGQGPPELVPRGQALYASDCAACHGERGEGRAEFFYPMLASQHYKYLLLEFDLILEGRRGNSNPAMPPILKNYSVDDKRAVAAYLAQLPAPGKTVTAETAE